MVEPLDSGVLRTRLPAAFLELYDLGEVLGRGAHGFAVKALQRRLRRPVVLKLLSLPTEDLAARFLQEAELLAGIRHPNVVRYYDSGVAGSLHYIALEYLAGETLQRRAASGVLDLDHIVSIAHDVLSGLEAIHDLGVVHRDLKPANIMILPDGHATIIDLGVARGGPTSDLTAPGVFLGTPGYASPEHLGARKVDGRTDLYSLGVILHELLTGTNPFLGGEIFEMVMRHATLRIDAVVGSRHPPHPALEALVVALLRKKPEERPATAREARALLEATEPGGPAPAAVVSPGGNSTSPVRRRSVRWVAVPVLLVIFITIGIAGRHAREPVEPSPTAAALGWDPDATLATYRHYHVRAGERRQARIAHFSSPGRWNLEGQPGLSTQRLTTELILDYQKVNELLQKLEAEVRDEPMDAHASSVFAALAGLRFMLWAEMSGEKQLSLHAAGPGFPSEELAPFFRDVPLIQDTRSLFHFRKATLATERCLEDIEREGRVPPSFDEVPRILHDCLWFTEGFRWTKEAQAGRDAEYARFQGMLAARAGESAAMRVAQAVTEGLESRPFSGSPSASSGAR